MPEFKIDKLVRDNYPDIYETENQQAVFKDLTVPEHKSALLKKIIEEINEIEPNMNNDDTASEIADVIQALNDYMEISGISNDIVQDKLHKKQEKFGGFLTGKYVETITLSDDDKWVEYYRNHPDLFPEK